MHWQWYKYRREGTKKKTAMLLHLIEKQWQLGEEFRKTTAWLLEYKDSCNTSIQADLAQAKLDLRYAVKTMYNNTTLIFPNSYLP
jgi:hypothetical protein